MNTIDAYYEYNIPINPTSLSVENNDFVTDVRQISVTTQTGEEIPTRWVQFRVPVNQFDNTVGGISDFRAIRFMRMYMNDWEAPVVLRFGTLDLVRGDFRRYLLTLDPNESNQVNNADPTLFEVAAVNIEANEQRIPINYVLPPGVVRERLNNNNNSIRQNEQSLSIRVDELEPQDGRGVFKNYNLDLRQYSRIRMFLHAEGLSAGGSTQDGLPVEDETKLQDLEMVGFLRIGSKI